MELACFSGFISFFDPYFKEVEKELRNTFLCYTFFFSQKKV